MGLDQYLTGRKFFWHDFKNPENERKEDGFRINTIEVDLGYWRKHPDLHGFIVQAFANGIDDCKEIELDHSAINCIITAVNDKRLPKTSGFFFGESGWEHGESQWKTDIEILKRALVWLENQPPGPEPAKLGEEIPLGDTGMIIRQVNVVDNPTRETRSIIYRASW